jgi:hypothetical protein
MTSECRTDDSRRAPRTSLYLAAALYCDGSPTPVRIRNISETGVLVEGAVVPVEGSMVQLIRGQMIAHGLVAWAEAGRCGLKFCGKIDVQRWSAITTNYEQQRVDEVVRLVKAGVVPLPVATLGDSGGAVEAADGHPALAADLQRVCQLLDKLGDELAGDADTVTRHGQNLQGLDISMQLVAALSSILAEGSDCASAGVKLETLRKSADQVLRQTA